MDLGFKGKVALVTGAGSQIGFGKAIALLLAKEGCSAVAVNDINLDDAKLTAEDVKALGCKSVALKADVTNKDEVQEMVKKVIGEYGKIDILFNVAGAILGGGPLEEQKEDLWNREIGLNLYGTMLVSQAVLPYMKKQNYGVIVNIGSGSTHMYSHGVSTYAMSKGAIDIFTKQLAIVEAGTGIRVNCVAPGPSPTNFIKAPDKQAVIDMLAKQIPMGRGATPADIANAAAFFASDISGYVTGQVLHVSGGSVL
ncbi:MAG: SDR family oxidoreductase [Dehalococcoidales bacterium]|nr:SDR family oxidoreductase [Dehalococcoidales bacterium]